MLPKYLLIIKSKCESTLRINLILKRKELKHDNQFGFRK